KDLSSVIEESKGFAVDVVATLTAQPVNQNNTNVTHVVVDRSGKMSAVLKEGEQGMTVVNDGKEMTIAVPAIKKYMVQPAPTSLRETFKDIMTGLTVMQGLPFVGPLMSEKPYDTLLDGVDEAKYEGEEKVD